MKNDISLLTTIGMSSEVTDIPEQVPFNTKEDHAQGISGVTMVLGKPRVLGGVAREHLDSHLDIDQLV